MQIDTTHLEVQHNTEQNRFELTIEGHLNVAQYILAGERIVFTHTEVHPTLEGQGIAALLAHAGLEYAKANQLKVMPLCPYVAAYMKRHVEYQSLLAAGFHV